MLLTKTHKNGEILVYQICLLQQCETFFEFRVIKDNPLYMKSKLNSFLHY